MRPLLIAVLIVTPFFLSPRDLATAEDEPGAPATDSSKAQLPAAVGESQRLDELPPEPPAAERAGKPPTREIENLPVPLRKKSEGRRRIQPEGLTLTTTPLSATLLSTFDGLRQGTNFRPWQLVSPPDANGSVSSHWYFQWVNSYFTKIDKQTGRMAIKPTNGSQIWRSLRGTLCAQHNDGDPVVIFDKAAGRWLLTQFAVDIERARFSECIAVSANDDPTSSYSLFEYKFPMFNDYPKFGIWRDGYYVTFNMFDHGDHAPPYKDYEYAFAGAQVCVFERDKMLSPSAAVRQSVRMKCFEPRDKNGYPAWSILPADIDGTTMPPDGSPEYLLAFNDAESELMLWRVTVDWTDLDRSEISEPISIKVKPFELTTCGENGQSTTCIPQKGTQTLLDSLSERLMYRLSYRNFGDRESLFVTHTVKAGKGSGIRWYELSRDLPAAPQSEFKVRQQQTFAPDNSFRWLGSMASDKMGNLILAYNVASSRLHPSFRFTGRRASDPLNALSAEGVIAEGHRSIVTPMNRGGNRWGDYASVSLDPTDDCTFWVTGQYTGAADNRMVAQSTASGQSARNAAASSSMSAANRSPDDDRLPDTYFWDTVVASLKFRDCH